MKRLILIIAIAISSSSVFTQDSLYVYKKGGIIDGKKISLVDSITFSTAQDSLYIKNLSATISSYAISSIDSISFARYEVTSPIPDYVEINGVKWATHNVASPGTFTTNVEDYGMFYQWSSKIGWPSTGTIGTIKATNGSMIWDSSWNGGFYSASEEDMWVTSKDPSPLGYRIPSISEVQPLYDTSKVTITWTTQNGIYGEKFTDKVTGNYIFLPAAGFRTDYNGLLSDVGIVGAYWFDRARSVYYAYFHTFTESSTRYTASYTRANGYSIRPVVK
jgi:hypothetical protein